MQPVGIEPTSTALQTAAMTTSARVAYLGCLTGIDPVLPLSQSRVQATTLRTPYRNTLNISSLLAQRTFRPCQGTEHWPR